MTDNFTAIMDKIKQVAKNDKDSYLHEIIEWIGTDINRQTDSVQFSSAFVYFNVE